MCLVPKKEMGKIECVPSRNICNIERVIKMKNKHVRSNFDDFLKKEGILEEAQAAAMKRVIAYQIKRIMKEKHLNQ